MSLQVEIDLSRYTAALNRIEPVRMEGEVVELVGLIVESRGPAAAMGDFCEIRTRGGRAIRAQVIGFRDGRVLSMPLEETEGLCLGDRIVARGGEGDRGSISRICLAECSTVSEYRSTAAAHLCNRNPAPLCTAAEPDGSRPY